MRIILKAHAPAGSKVRFVDRAGRTVLKTVAGPDGRCEGDADVDDDVNEVSAVVRTPSGQLIQTAQTRVESDELLPEQMALLQAYADAVEHYVVTDQYDADEVCEFCEATGRTRLDFLADAQAAATAGRLP